MPDTRMEHATLSWNALLRQTEAMRAAAAEADWLRVAELAGARHQALVAHFEQFPVGPDTAVFYQRHLTQLLSEEQELKALTVAARREVMKQGLGASQKRRAVAAYMAS